MNISDLLNDNTTLAKASAKNAAEVCTIGPSKPPKASKKAGNARAVKRVTKFAVVPDKKRKRQYYMSATQKRLRSDHEAYESRVFNLTLDINNLKQEVVRLMEYRDLQITRLLLSRLRAENELLKTVEAMIRGVRETESVFPACRLSRTIANQSSSGSGTTSASGGVYEFAIRLDRSKFSCVISSMQVLFVEENNDNEDEEAAAARRICGAGGWVVKVSGNFTFQFMRHLATAMFPHAVGDEMLLARLIGLRMTCPVRLFLYFNAQRELVQQVAQADMLPALQEARPREIAALINSDNSSERD